MNFTPQTSPDQQAALSDLIDGLSADQLRDLVTYFWLSTNHGRANIKSWKKRAFKLLNNQADRSLT